MYFMVSCGGSGVGRFYVLSIEGRGGAVHGL